MSNVLEIDTTEMTGVGVVVVTVHKAQRTDTYTIYEGGEGWKFYSTPFHDLSCFSTPHPHSLSNLGAAMMETIRRASELGYTVEHIQGRHDCA